MPSTGKLGFATRARRPGIRTAEGREMAVSGLGKTPGCRGCLSSDESRDHGKMYSVLVRLLLGILQGASVSPRGRWASVSPPGKSGPSPRRPAGRGVQLDAPMRTMDDNVGARKG